MASQDLTIDFENKTIINEFVKGKRLILQKVILAVQCWIGDWFLDGNYGIPYDYRVDNKSLLLSDLQDIILGVDGVISLQDLDVKIVYEGVRSTQKAFNIKSTIITQDEDVVLLNGLVPIIGS